MVFKNLKPKSSNKSSKSIFVDTRPDGTTIFICHNVNQVELLNKLFTEKGNIPVGYEKWDDGDDTKYILTYQIEDVNTPVIRN
tara:strand:+ start:544 stop:792 length:249 start_codon:yes stop_codon:yes gene_type:complete